MGLCVCAVKTGGAESVAALSGPGSSKLTDLDLLVDFELKAMEGRDKEGQSLHFLALHCCVCVCVCMCVCVVCE